MSDTKLQAEVERLRSALATIIAAAAEPQRLYDSHGPTWTGKDGHEYADMSYVIDKCAELSEIARDALDALPTEEPGEMVEVRADVLWHPGTKEAWVEDVRSDIEQDGWHSIATITARVPRPRVPVLVATVEPTP